MEIRNFYGFRGNKKGKEQVNDEELMETVRKKALMKAYRFRYSRR